MEMGDIIKAKREEMGLTQDELGKMLGVNKAAVNKWESGRVQNLKRQTIQKLASIFNIAPSTLFGWEDKDEKTKEIINLYLALDEDGRKDAEQYIQFLLSKRK